MPRSIKEWEKWAEAQFYPSWPDYLIRTCHLHIVWSLNWFVMKIRSSAFVNGMKCCFYAYLFCGILLFSDNGLSTVLIIISWRRNIPAMARNYICERHTWPCSTCCIAYQANLSSAASKTVRARYTPFWALKSQTCNFTNGALGKHKSAFDMLDYIIKDETTLNKVHSIVHCCSNVLCSLECLCGIVTTLFIRLGTLCCHIFQCILYND